MSIKNIEVSHKICYINIKFIEKVGDKYKMFNFSNMSKMFFDKIMVALDIIIIILLMILIINGSYNIVPIVLFLIFFICDMISKIIYISNNDKEYDNKKSR